MRFLYGLKRWVQNLDNRMGENIPLYDPFKFDDETTNAPIEFFIEFITNNLRYNYQLKFGRREVLSESLSYFPNGKTASLFERVRSGSKALTHTVRFGSKVTGIKPFTVFPNQLILSKFIIDTPGENITEAAKYLADLVVSNGYHEDIKLGLYNDMMEWIAQHPEDKKKLGELLAFADTGVKDFELENGTLTSLMKLKVYIVGIIMDSSLENRFAVHGRILWYPGTFSAWLLYPAIA